MTDRWRYLDKYLSPVIAKPSSCAAWFVGDGLVQNDSLRLILKLGRRHIILSGVFELFRIIFSLLVPLALRYLIDYVERAESAIATTAATTAEAVNGTLV